MAKKYKGICPICGKALRIHTVLSVSGYVYYIIKIRASNPDYSF